MNHKLSYLVATLAVLLAACGGGGSDPVALDPLAAVPASASALLGSTSTNGSAAYQYISGKLWSLASSPCTTSAVRIGQRWSSGIRCSVEAKSSLTTGESSC